jgi:hypothetical protein
LEKLEKEVKAIRAFLVEISECLMADTELVSREQFVARISQATWKLVNPSPENNNMEE